MTRSQMYARNKVKHVGAAVCNVCEIKRADCVEVKKNWFTTIRICDSCGREIFRSFDPARKGGA